MQSPVPRYVVSKDLDVEAQIGRIHRRLLDVGAFAQGVEPSHRSVRWCDPVASDGEARLVVAKASKLRGEASSEARRVNAVSAHDLRFRASILEGRLVHADWRQTVRAALLMAA